MPAESLRTFSQECELSATSSDRDVARRTLPLNDEVPAVEPDLWLMHVVYARSRESEVRRLLVEQYQGYALLLARRMHREGMPIADLRQVAFEALLVALDRFDPELSCPFLGYASKTISGALKRHYRDFGWLMRVPRKVHELANPIRQATDELTGELGRSPSLGEVALRVGIDVETLIEVREAMQTRSLSSLTPLLADGDGAVHDAVGHVDPGFERSAQVLDLRRALRELDDDERNLLRLYYFDDYTQTEVAELLGVSQMEVSRRIRSATRRLADRLAVNL